MSCQRLESEHEEEFYRGRILVIKKDVEVGRDQSVQKVDTALGNFWVIAGL